MVVGSPVKGGEPMDNDTSNGGVYDDDSLEIVMDITSDTSGLGEDEYLVPIAGGSPKETGKKKEKDDNSQQGMPSRRASLASLALSASLSALPPKGSMGPPPIPRHGRITRSISGGHASTSHTKSPEADEAGISDMTMKTKDSSSSIGSPLGFLKNCVVFVDVRTDDGDDAGSLFVEMLKSAGAKVPLPTLSLCQRLKVTVSY